MEQIFIDYFWNVATAVVGVITPIIGIKLLFNIIGDMLFKERF